MIDQDIPASICTDNRLMSRTDTLKVPYRRTLVCVSPFRANLCVNVGEQELRKAVDGFNLTPQQLKRVVMAGFEAAFFPGSYSDHRAYLRKVEAMYDDVAARHGV